jgi:hypothetical protein
MRRHVLLAAALGLGACTEGPPTPDLIGGVEPLTPAQGFSIHIDAFEVPPGIETQDCYFLSIPDINNGQDIWIDRFKIGQRTGSHHMNIFRVNTLLNLRGEPGDVVRGGECRISTNWSDWPLVVNSQESSTENPFVDWQLPDGVAQRFRPGELIMVQSHYVNGDLQPTPNGGEVRINFYKSDLTNPIEMGSLFATQQSIRICRSGPQIQTFDGACSFPRGSEVHVAAANGHFHGRGTRFDIYSWDGQSLDHPTEDELFYTSTAWDEPPMSLDLDVVVPDGGGIWWTCQYEWREPPSGCDYVDEHDPQHADDCCYTFGNSAEGSEHCNVFLYYWPKVETDVFCN